MSFRGLIESTEILVYTLYISSETLLVRFSRTTTVDMLLNVSSMLQVTREGQVGHLSSQVSSQIRQRRKYIFNR